MPQKTALNNEHLKLGAKLVDFGGWELPVQYAGVMAEHRACREQATIFDVSHMGEFTLQGLGAERALNEIVTNDLTKLKDFQGLYTVMCKEDGTVIDDLIVYKLGKEKFFIVVNASNVEKDFIHMKAHLPASLQFEDKSSRYSLIALQGPWAENILSLHTDIDLKKISYYHRAEGKLKSGTPAIIAHTGYTGEDGFEIYLPWDKAPELWSALLSGNPRPTPAGLGARDTLRIEMKYALYGHELSEETNPLEAGLGWVVKLQKDKFIGKDALTQIKAKGLTRKLVGFESLTKAIPRQGYTVKDKEGTGSIGIVTSGTLSPTLQKPIGIAYVDARFGEVGQEINFEMRGQLVPARVVKTPFYVRDNDDVTKP